MDDEPSKPPKRKPPPYWAAAFLFSPAALILAGVLVGSKQAGPYLAMGSVLITSPIALAMCIYLGIRLANYVAKDRPVVWLLCWGGVLAVNSSIAWAGCSLLIK